MTQKQNFIISNGISKENGFILFNHFNSPLFNNIRVIAYDNKYNDPYFIGKDVCNVLEYSNSPKALRDHVSLNNKLIESIPIINSDIDRTNRSVNYSGRGAKRQNMVLINQAGLFELANNSKMPMAKELQSWVCNVVLPTLNKIGSFTEPNVARAIQNNEIDSNTAYSDFNLRESIRADIEFRQNLMEYNQIQLNAMNSITNQFIKYYNQPQRNPNNTLMTVGIDKNIPHEVYTNLREKFILLQ